MSEPVVKICGITRPEDAEMCVRAGARWLGLNFWPEAPRGVDRLRGRVVAAAARRADPSVVLVGVFVNQPARDIEAVVDAVGLDLVQLHGDESPEFTRRFGDRAIKALRPAGEHELPELDRFACPSILLDSRSGAYGGSGVVGDWPLAARAVRASGKQIVLAGGLTPDNVADAVRAVRPFAVDVASGVESAPGVKDPDRVARFVRAALEAA